MPALVVGPLTVPGVVSARRTVVEAVERDRSYNNTMLATQIAASKDEWEIEVTHVTAAEVASIESALAATPPIACSGDVLGGSVNCHARLNGSNPALDVRPLRHMVSFTLMAS